MVIGSGPIIIGQAAEFDYAGTQACKSLKEEGVEVVLVNSNPATIMTDEDVADHVYIEPLTIEVIERIIEREQPDGIIVTLGGQTGLNLGVDLDKAGILEKYDVSVLGTSISSIEMAEDRDGFKSLLDRINEPLLLSFAVESIDEAETAANRIGFPVVIRPAYTLGGTGGGIANNFNELQEEIINNFINCDLSQCSITELQLSKLKKSNGRKLIMTRPKFREYFRKELYIRLKIKEH